jgi:hypothetical protein
MNRIRRLAIGGIMAGVIGIQTMSGGVALAHNAGHIILPDGTCHNVGSGKDAPYVSENNPHYHEPDPNDPNDPNVGRLDLKDGPGDQYGARYAADQGNSRVRPGDCPEK